MVMLVYIAVALGYVPAGVRPLAVLVTGRVSLGLGGVLIVVGAVTGALGLCSLFGMWSTLIIMEVRSAPPACLVPTVFAFHAHALTSLTSSWIEKIY